MWAPHWRVLCSNWHRKPIAAKTEDNAHYITIVLTTTTIVTIRSRSNRSSCAVLRSESTVRDSPREAGGKDNSKSVISGVLATQELCKSEVLRALGPKSKGGHLVEEGQ